MQSLSRRILVVAAFVAALAVPAVAVDTVPASVINQTNAGNDDGMGNIRGGGRYSSTGAILNNLDVIGNTASSPQNLYPSGSAQGGGLYVNGNLQVNNSNIVDNVAYASTAQGGGAYLTGNLSISVSAGASSIIANNRVNAGRNAFHIQNTSTGQRFLVDIGANGTLDLLDPVTIVSTGAYHINIDLDTGSVFTWDGANTVDTLSSNVTIDGGTIHFGDTFTLQAINNTVMTLDIGMSTPVERLTFGLARNANLALFNFDEAGPGRTMTVRADTVISATLGRQIVSFTDSYLIAEGLDPVNAAEVAGNMEFQSGSTYIAGRKPYAVGGDVWADVRFDSPFEYSGVNALSAMGPLDSLLNGPRAEVISDAEYAALLDNTRSAHPEAFMEQAGVFIGGIDALTRTARELGMRGPQRARVAAAGGGYILGVGEVVEAPREYVTDYGDPVAATVVGDGAEAGTEYQGTAAAASPYAYPSIVDYIPPSFADGLRMWAGYVGDWSEAGATGDHNGYESSTHGFVLGLSRDFGTFASVGVYGGYTANTTTSKLANSEVSADAGHIGIQARISPVEAMKELSIYADLGYHWSDNSMRRTLGGWSAEGDFAQSGISYGFGVEHVFLVNGISISPYLDLRHIEIDQDGMRERGNSVTIADISNYDRSGLTTRLGAHVSRDFTLCDGSVLSPALNIAWKHEYGDRAVQSSASFIRGIGSGPFAMTSSESRQDSVDLGLSLRMARQLSDCATFGANLGYNLNVARGASAHTLHLGAEIGF